MNFPSEDFIMPSRLIDILKCFKGTVVLSIGFQANPQSVFFLERVDDVA